MKKPSSKKPAAKPAAAVIKTEAADGIVYIRTTISLPENVLDKGKKIAGRFRLSFSDLLARLIEEKDRNPSATITIVPLEAPEPPAPAKRATR